MLRIQRKARFNQSKARKQWWKSVGFWYIRNLKNRIKQTEKGGCIYKQKKNTSIEQSPNEMERMPRDMNLELGSKILQK